ncbi:hypothetical protein DEU29_102249 [Idiomarina aquatica]|uniref:Motility associated factor glycosyltransferase family protein n=1 Tax=Idiomarina aquatica TaxID=1327752 RepID=A0A4R6PQT1_9GAMM|nr:6-hydroxymethylpterin diphosphokinase MptE-like protein [Idiomarina aquatica]TDP40348.1 hypothetical protein DEU29_102249 [Idiomarina aquatica]
MQTNIAYQTLDDQSQTEIDKRIYDAHNSRKERNLAFFSVQFPELHKQILNNQSTKANIFFNRNEEVNVVNTETGETLYPLNCNQAQLEHVKNTSIHSLKYSANQFDEIYSVHGVITGFDSQLVGPRARDSLIGLGIGLGAAYEYLVQHEGYKNLVVFEPSLDLLLASFYSTDWYKVNQLLNSRGGNLAFLINSTGSVLDDVEEVLNVFKLDDLDIYQHLHYPNYDAFSFLLRKLGYDNIDNRLLLETTEEFEKIENNVPLFSQTLAQQVAESEPEACAIEKYEFRFKENIECFEQYFPDIALAMRDYSPKNWFFVPSKNFSKANIYNKNRQAFWYGLDPGADANASFSTFLSNPVKTLPTHSINGGKLSEYTFYRYAGKIRDLLNSMTVRKSGLPEKTPSLILMSSALGHAQKKIVEQVDIDYLLYYEPNIEFFYWSLFTFDWKVLISSFDLNKKKLNLSIGDDGSNLVSDIKSSMVKENGFYLLNSYLFLERHISQLRKPIHMFREELTVSVALSETFHHARYAISHCLKNFTLGNTVVNTDTIKSTDIRSNEVLIVGNGPSLDLYWDLIKEKRSHFIIVSCGTALGALWKQGITPDFHAEVEQNRVTYDIISSIKDKSYLKSICLLAPVWTHPDTAGLFKKHYGIFTSLGGGMEVVGQCLEVLKRKPPIALSGNPTVSNFAASAILTLGFEKVTLVGVDLGFNDILKHHSKHSSYYRDDGSEKFSYEDTVEDRIIVKGNKRSFIYTKLEFYLAIKNLGQLVRTFPKARVNNLSDGAFIDGTNYINRSDFENSLARNFCFENTGFDECFSKDLTRDLGRRLSMQIKKEKSVRLPDEIKAILLKVREDPQDAIEYLSNLKRNLLEQALKGNLIAYSLFSPVLPYLGSVLMKLSDCDFTISSNAKLFEDTVDILIEMIGSFDEEYKDDPYMLESTSVNTGLTV